MLQIVLVILDVTAVAAIAQNNGIELKIQRIELESFSRIAYLRFEFDSLSTKASTAALEEIIEFVLGRKPLEVISRILVSA